MLILLQLFLMLLVILLAAEVFTNALEHLGEKIGISEGVTGSLFAAVGTALPETMVPLLALLSGASSAEVNAEIGVGAILGAPLMLSTLSVSLMSVAVFRDRGIQGLFTPERTGLERDLNVFLAAFSLSILALYLPNGQWRLAMAVGLVLLYVTYVILTVQASEELVEQGHETEAENPLFLTYLKLPKNTATIALQLAIGLGLLVGGAKGFINGVEAGAHLLGISTLLLSLLIIPVATELPEKVNSILWVRRKKDTLAFGNITGAMVFQGTLLPAIGITLTPWEPRKEVVAGVILTFLGSLWLRVVLARGGIRVWHLWINGALYLTYLAITLG